MTAVRAARAAASVVALAALALGVPGVASAVPGPPSGDDVPDAQMAESIRTFDLGPAVRGIDIAASVLPLESEETTGGRITVRMSADVLFDFNKATLTDAARRRIGRLATRLRGSTGTVEVAGHSDAIGAPAYNQALSARRAEAVKAELVRLLGGSAGSRVQARGYGENRPVAPNEKGGKDDPEGRAKNRRVDITFQKA
ncbi:OmpA family protein [Actinomadura viridis]|uniref:OmpA family protein n=1 Tax=Actinomadura viridis TaxID=58110 RepID=UPI0036B0C26F